MTLKQLVAKIAQLEERMTALQAAVVQLSAALRKVAERENG